MKIQKVSRWFSLLLFMTMVAGCSSLTESVTTPSRATPTLPFNSASPTETVTPTLTPIATRTSVPLSTLTTVPTLPIEDARQKLLELLATNNGCSLPCLWGITPGKSNYQETRNILIPLSSIGTAETTYFEPTPLRDVLGGTITPLYVEGDLSLNARIGYLYGDDGIVSRIGFRVLEEKVEKDPRDPSGKSWLSKTPIYGLPTFIKRTEYYSLSHLLSEQGIPASVMVASSGLSINRDRSISTRLAVFYPDQGIWAQYTTLVNEKEVGSSLISCPVHAHIEMNLFPPGNPDAFFSLLDQTDWGVTKVGYKPLEEATSMSVEEFYQAFRNSADKCIETPTNLWPTPER